MHHRPDSAHCHNCGALLAGPFCHACGQEARRLDPSLRDLLRDVTPELLNVDGRIFRSVRKLLFAPGFLTVEQNEGRRAGWVAPLRLYLIFSLIYFAVGSFGANSVRVNVSDDESAREDLARLGFQNEQELQGAIQNALATWAPRVMFVLVPLSAWLVQIVCRRQRRHYPQHLYFALHVHAAFFAVSALAAAAELTGLRLLAGAFKVVQVVYVAVYVVMAFKVVYGGPLRRAVLRAAISGALYFLAVVAAIVAVVLPAVFWKTP